jgi:hypothetical protein
MGTFEDVGKIAREIRRKPEEIPVVLEGMRSAKGAAKFVCEKALRSVSESDPDLLYPYFTDFIRLLDHENSFVKWGAILTVSNLAAVDSEGKLERAFRKYYAPLGGPAMVAAANIVVGSVKIARSKPHLADRIAAEILKVESADFRMHGEPSPECNAVACGQALDTFDAIYELIAKKKAVDSFMKRQCGSARPQVRRKAEKLVKKYGL